MRRRLIIDVKFVDGDWLAVWRGMGRESASTGFTKQDAIDGAVNDARDHRNLGGIAQVVIHGKDGRIQSERTYGSDPKRRKG